MKFEIHIKGSPHAISRLRQRLSGLLPYIENGPGQIEGNNKEAKIILLESRENLPFSLLKISRMISRLKRDRLLGADFDVRVRNLAFSEPTVESHLFKEPFRPIPAISVQLSDPLHPSVTDGQTIKIFPHHAFGTGKHPTTRLCLMYLDHMAQSPSFQLQFQSGQVLDFGCGTGLLAIAAVKMGARCALGVELDNQSAHTARKNVELNGLSGKIFIKEGSWEVVQGKYALILANLVTAALFRAGRHIPNHLEDHGKVVVSGFSPNQQEELEKFFLKWGLMATDKSSLEGWSAMVLEKSTSGRES